MRLRARSRATAIAGLWVAVKAGRMAVEGWSLQGRAASGREMTGVRLADRLKGSIALPDDVVDRRDAEENAS
jgi:hypothetical protein